MGSTTLVTMTLSITSPRVIGIIATLSINDIQHKLLK
jgi:hypothetical protein